MEAFKFENPQYLYYLLVLPAMVIIFAISRFLRMRALKRFGRIEEVQKLIPLMSVRRPWLRFVFLSMAVGFLVVAIANPMVGVQPEEVERHGVNLVIMLDVSRSMLAEDIKPNRIERARLAASRILQQLDYDRIGLVTFAGTAIAQIPITNDRSALQMMLPIVRPEQMAVQGTALGAAIERAVAAFDVDKMKSNVIVILSDGENHADDPTSAAEMAAEHGIIIHAIGIGTQGGAPIPTVENNRLVGFHRDRQGNTVVTRIDEATLTSVTEITGGILSSSQEAGLGTQPIVDAIKAMESDAYRQLEFARFESRYYIFLIAAMILLMMELLIPDRKNKWLKIEKLFR